MHQLTLLCYMTVLIYKVFGIFHFDCIKKLLASYSYWCVYHVIPDNAQPCCSVSIYVHNKKLLCEKVIEP